jgi:hypothetical protein
MKRLLNPSSNENACLFVLQSLELKPLFFGRKFEPAVNQDIINSMDVYLFGKEMRGTWPL